MRKRNENRPGYKQTKAGWIPEEWECVPGKRAFSNSTEKGHDSLPILAVTINAGVVHRNTLVRKSPNAIAGNGSLHVRVGDIAYNMMRAWQGAIGLVIQEGVTSPAYVVLRPRKGVCSPFMLYLFKSSHYLYFLQSYSYGLTGDRLRLYYKDFAMIPMVLPPLPEQERIAEVSSAWDRAIALTGKLIDAKQRLKKGLMQQLLTGRLRFPEFGKPALEKGELPKGWKQATLRDVASVNPGTKRPCHYDCSVTFLAMADISEQGRVSSYQQRQYRSVSEGFTAFRNGDILVAKITPCFENGKGAHLSNLMNGIGYGSTEFHVIRANHADARFLFLHTQSRPFRGRGEANMTGSAGQKRVPTEFIRRYLIPLPKIEEQKRIAAILYACDREIQLLTRKRGLLQEEKKGLMQKLLTGEVRVVLQ